MITKFETQSPIDDTRLSGITYTPDNPVAVMNIVHGFGEHSGRYTHMMGHLGERGIATAAIDVRGHGKSDGKRGVCLNYNHLHSDMDALFEQSRKTFPNLPQIVFGHSMGGGLVLHYILSHGAADQKAVIASAPLLQLTQPVAKPLEMIMRGLRYIAPELTLKNTISGNQISTLPEEQKIYENDPLNHGQLGIGLAVQMFDAGAWVIDNAANMPLPTLVLHSKNDKLTAFEGSEAFTNAASNCTFKIFENVEHEMHNDQSRSDVYAHIIKFIGTQT